MKISRILTFVFCAVCASLLLGGCLVASKKTITIRLNPDGSGSGSIVFHNIGSIQEGEEDNSLADYSRLVDTWVYGDNFEAANPALENVKKRLYAEGERLNGEVSFTFTYPSDIGLYRYKNTGPWMYHAPINVSEVEQFDSSNGEYGGEVMPVIFWPEKTKEFKVFTVFEQGEGSVTSLYPQFKRLGVKQKSTKE